MTELSLSSKIIQAFISFHLVQHLQVATSLCHDVWRQGYHSLVHDTARCPWAEPQRSCSRRCRWGRIQLCNGHGHAIVRWLRLLHQVTWQKTCREMIVSGVNRSGRCRSLAHYATCKHTAIASMGCTSVPSQAVRPSPTAVAGKHDITLCCRTCLPSMLFCCAGFIAMLRKCFSRLNRRRSP